VRLDANCYRNQDAKRHRTQVGAKYRVVQPKRRPAAYKVTQYVPNRQFTRVQRFAGVAMIADQRIAPDDGSNESRAFILVRGTAGEHRRKSVFWNDSRFTLRPKPEASRNTVTIWSSRSLHNEICSRAASRRILREVKSNERISMCRSTLTALAGSIVRTRDA